MAVYTGGGFAPLKTAFPPPALVPGSCRILKVPPVLPRHSNHNWDTYILSCWPLSFADCIIVTTAIMVKSCRLLFKKFCDSPFKASVLLNKMCHLLACLFSSRLTGIRWDKPDLPHLGSPLPIVVSLSRPLSEVVLPEMYHLMRQGGENLVRLSSSKVDGVKGNFIGNFFRI